ncbi:capsular polysaccharide synthesis protein-domain-containing protein [Bombardia bombarda]|uniref:Capsular polysaccharide synthesis protein-domain-containing protein n=1 Tax=Bombardia bombarda TaxID=252184 RepID=A0AA39WV06_9PEZI|nr:capsular polysaccharide synthesis protein-domain-containing protein [Bombardia bombarda]
MIALPHYHFGTMETQLQYHLPIGMHLLPPSLLDLRPTSEIDNDLLHPAAVASEKNIWFFWDTGFQRMPAHNQRNIRTWHRRLSKLGWTIRVVDKLPGSPLNISNFLDIHDPHTFPSCFTQGTITGAFSAQHTSDLVRFPLLLRYGGVYADAGMMQIGDLDRLWNQTIGNPDSPYEVLSYDGNDPQQRTLCNYFLASNRDNPLFARCHRLFLALWEGKTSTHGLHAHPLLKGVGMMGQSLSFVEDGIEYGPDQTSKMLTDYIIQGQVMTMVMGLVDKEDSWNGPAYAANHVYVIEFMVGAQLINQFTAWDGRRAFELMSLHLPTNGEPENDDQGLAREIVETCLGKSFGFKLATGIIVRIMGDTLGSFWKKNIGSDDVQGTYAHWLRYGMLYWNQDEVPPPVMFNRVFEPIKEGSLLKEN